MKIGYGVDWAGTTRRYEVIDETVSGRYIVSHLVYAGMDNTGKEIWGRESLELKSKNEITDIQEVKDAIH